MQTSLACVRLQKYAHNRRISTLRIAPPSSAADQRFAPTFLNFFGARTADGHTLRRLRKLPNILPVMSQKSSCLTKPTSQGEHQHHACRQPVPSPKHGPVVQVQPPARKRRKQGPSSNTGCAFRGNVPFIINSASCVYREGLAVASPGESCVKMRIVTNVAIGRRGKRMTVAAAPAAAAGIILILGVPR